MKKQNTAVNVITAILAAFLSTLLVIMCVIIPVFKSLTSITTPKKLVTLVQEIDYKELVTENEGVKDAIEEFGIPSDVVNELVSSKAVSELLGLFAEDVSAALTGKELEQSSITPDAIKSIVNDNIDEIFDIVKNTANEEFSEDISDEDIKQVKDEIIKAVNENADEIVESLPDVKEIVTVMEVEDAQIIKTILGPTITIILLAVAAVLAGLIYACRFRNFNALLWLGIDFGSAGLIVTLITAFIGSKFISALITDMISINGTVVDSVIKVYTNGLITGLIILFVLCAVFITGYVLLKKFVLNKKPTEEMKEIPTEN